MSFQEFFAAGKGDYGVWYNTYGKKQGVKPPPFGGYMQLISADKAAGMSNGLLTLKYGALIKDDVGDHGAAVLKGALMGIVGGPVGIVVGGFAAGAAMEAKEKAAANATKLEVAALTGQKFTPTPIAPAQQTAQAGFQLLEMDAPKLMALSILIIFVFILFFTKKKT